MAQVSLSTLMGHANASWTRDQMRAVDQTTTALWRETRQRFPERTVHLAQLHRKGEPEWYPARVKIMSVHVRRDRVEIQVSILAPEELRGGVRVLDEDLMEIVTHP